MIPISIIIYKQNLLSFCSGSPTPLINNTYSELTLTIQLSLQPLLSRMITTSLYSPSKTLYSMPEVISTPLLPSAFGV